MLNIEIDTITSIMLCMWENFLFEERVIHVLAFLLLHNSIYENRKGTRKRKENHSEACN